MNNKLEILYDATILVKGELDSHTRSGIYFVAKNVLQELLKRDNVLVYLYARNDVRYGLRMVHDRFFPSARLYGQNNRLFNFCVKFISYARKKTEKIRPHLCAKLLSYFLFNLEKCFFFFTEEWTFFIRRKKWVFFSPFMAAPWFMSFQRTIKKFFILYDVIPYKLKEYESQSNQGWFNELVKNLNTDDFYFFISEATKIDFLEVFPFLSQAKSKVTLLAADKMLVSEEKILTKEHLFKKYGLPYGKKYVFSLCTLEPRKNLIRAVKTFIKFVKKNNIKDLVYVLGGGSWLSFEHQLKNSMDDLSLFDNLVFRTGYISDDDLPMFYSCAEWFVFTSQYEGFGLPPLEAMQCGCPVITSNNTSLPEVVGDAGIMIDWDDDDQHIASYEKYYYDDQLKKINGQKGRVQSQKFSWEKTVDEMICEMRKT